MSMSDALSLHATDAIDRIINVAPVPTPGELGSRLDEVFEVLETATELNKHEFTRVALQFPDELLQYSVPLYHSLRGKAPGKEFFVMADTTFGSCCVDEVAAQHVDAEAVVHFGHACLSPTSRLPTIYIFPRRPIDILDCAHSLVDASGLGTTPTTKHTAEAVTVMLDVAYHYQADRIFTELRAGIPEIIPIYMWKLRERFVPAAISDKINAPSDGGTETRAQKPAQQERHRTPLGISAERCVILYVGGESLALNNVLMTHGGSPVYSYDPSTRSTRLESPRSNRLLLRRYAMVHKARDADVFGILVGTLGIVQYLPVIRRLRQIISWSQKKSYTISVGKLNPAKLANFMEIECFVLVACPENSIIDTKEFLRPIITPHELIAALSSEIEWSSSYTLDFDEVLAIKAQNRPEKSVHSDDVDDDDQPSFSFVTGTYRGVKRFGGHLQDDLPATRTSDLLSTRNSDGSVAAAAQSAAGQYLQGRAFKGLMQNNGRDQPSVLEQGRYGVAQGYREFE